MARHLACVQPGIPTLDHWIPLSIDRIAERHIGTCAGEPGTKYATVLFVTADRDLREVVARVGQMVRPFTRKDLLAELDALTPAATWQVS